jgi:hypothetical protein
MNRFKDRPICAACGDECFGNGEHQPGKWRGKWYCWECIEELRDGKISTTPARTYPSGGGCPLEPNDDAGPWGENAIREMEG